MKADSRHTTRCGYADLTKMVGENNEFLNSAVLTKAKCWEYERENRTIERGQAAGYRPFPQEALTGVILGARMDDQRRADILDLIGEHRPDIEVIQAEFDDRSYQLNLSTVEIRR